MAGSDRPALFTAAEVREGVGRIAREVLRWLDGSPDGPLDLLVLLEGARPLARDLEAELKGHRPGLTLRTHFLKVRGTAGSSLLEERRMEGPEPDWAALGASPLLVLDDLWDSGKTLSAARDLVLARTGRRPKSAVLVRKLVPRADGPDFFGLALDLDPETLAARGLKDLWLFGYGMDLDDRHRELDHIAALEIKA